MDLSGSVWFVVDFDVFAGQVATNATSHLPPLGTPLAWCQLSPGVHRDPEIPPNVGDFGYFWVSKCLNLTYFDQLQLV